MATTDFEVRQLLKAYRKGLISDELFAEQMKDLNGARRYAYNGTSHATESEITPITARATPLRARWSCISWTSSAAGRTSPLSI